jgi:hypothetical protein
MAECSGCRAEVDIHVCIHSGGYIRETEVETGISFFDTSHFCIP